MDVHTQDDTVAIVAQPCGAVPGVDLITCREIGGTVWHAFSNTHNRRGGKMSVSALEKCNVTWMSNGNILAEEQRDWADKWLA